MGRKHTFYDREFGRDPFDADDPGAFEHGLVFVGMPLREDMQEVFATIRNVCTQLSLRSARVDDTIVGSGFIIREVTAMIEQAEFLIFDLTHERPNVYYELGYAHGVGNESREVLLIARAGTNVHFDSAPLRVTFYRSIDHLREIVTSSLTEMKRITRR